jgi:hypothetical protein
LFLLNWLLDLKDQQELREQLDRKVQKAIKETRDKLALLDQQELQAQQELQVLQGLLEQQARRD